MPYFDSKLNKVRVRTRERCRTCGTSWFLCPLRSILFSTRGLDVAVYACPNYVDGRRGKLLPKYRRTTIE
jgi:hypothetical protein